MPYSERRRRWSGSSKGSKGMDVEEEPELPEPELDEVDPKLKKEEEELTKIATGIGKVNKNHLKIKTFTIHSINEKQFKNKLIN